VEIQQIPEMLAEMNAQMDAKQAKTESWGEKIRAETEAIRAKTKAVSDKRMEARQEEMLARIQENTQAIREVIKSGEAEIISIICTFGSELKETIQRVMRAAIQSVQSELDEATASNEATEAETDPEMMQFIEYIRRCVRERPK
jgi:hypothetical protein